MLKIKDDRYVHEVTTMKNGYTVILTKKNGNTKESIRTTFVSDGEDEEVTLEELIKAFATAKRMLDIPLTRIK